MYEEMMCSDCGRIDFSTPTYKKWVHENLHDHRMPVGAGVCVFCCYEYAFLHGKDW